MPVNVTPKAESPLKVVDIRNIYGGQLFYYHDDEHKSIFMRTLCGTVRLTVPYDSHSTCFVHAEDTETSHQDKCILLDDIAVTITNI